MVLATTAPSRAEETADSAKGFDVQELTISTAELAKDLGYELHGATWHFTAPTYVRVKVWNVGDNPVKSPEEPQNSLPPNDVLALRGPLKTTSLCVLTRETDTADSAKHGATQSTQLSFRVNLSGVDSAEGGSEGEGNQQPTADVIGKLQRTLATVLGRKLSDEAKMTESAGSKYSSQVDVYSGDGSSGACVWSNGDAGGLASQLQQLRDVAGQPDEEAKVRELVTKWRATTEKNLLERPLKVYGYTSQRFPSGKVKDVKHRVSFVLVLECSRQPFPPDQPKPTPTALPAATP